MDACFLTFKKSQIKNSFCNSFRSIKEYSRFSCERAKEIKLLMVWDNAVKFSENPQVSETGFQTWLKHTNKMVLQFWIGFRSATVFVCGNWHWKSTDGSQPHSSSCSHLPRIIITSNLTAFSTFPSHFSHLGLFFDCAVLLLHCSLPVVPLGSYSSVCAVI